jgi:energy-converting hydrogenase Eha subunit G
MQDDIFLLTGLVVTLLISLLSAIFLSRKYPYFNFLEWFGTVFLLLGWYSLIISSTIEMVIPGKWVNGVQLTGFVAAYIVPPGVLFWALYKRRKEYRSRQKVGTAQV